VYQQQSIHRGRSLLRSGVRNRHEQYVISASWSLLVSTGGLEPPRDFSH
jgi:hypothetical protein